MVERTVFAPRVGELLVGADLNQGSVYAVLESHEVVPAEAEHVLDAVAAGVLDARQLEVRRGAPLLRVQRRTVAASGEVLEWSDDRYRPDRVSIAITNSASRPGAARRLVEEAG